jgi:transposase
MVKKYSVALSVKERKQLKQLISQGKTSARELLHARILLKADGKGAGKAWKDERIAEALEVTVRTVARVRQRFVEEGLEACLRRRPQKNRRPPLIDGETEAHLIALACSQPPQGQARWTLSLLSDKLVELKYVDSVSRETVRRTLKKTLLSRG